MPFGCLHTFWIRLLTAISEDGKHSLPDLRSSFELEFRVLLNKTKQNRLNPFPPPEGTIKLNQSSHMLLEPSTP